MIIPWNLVIPLEWSRIESGSLSPWKHVWILFYAYFFFGLGPWNLKRYSKTMFDHFCFVKGPGTSTIWCFWVLIPSDCILNHLNHDSGFYSGSLWQCFLLAFLRILADKRIKRYKSKKKSRNQANGATTNLSLEFDQLWIFWPSPSLPKDRKV